MDIKQMRIRNGENSHKRKYIIMLINIVLSLEIYTLYI